jgi:hypothetical protein
MALTQNSVCAFGWGIAPRSVELCEASAAVNDVKRLSRFEQQRGCLFPCFLFVVSSKRGS